MRQFQCVATTYVFPIKVCFTISLFLKQILNHCLFQWNEHVVFMEFVMHLDDNNRQPIDASDNICFG